MKHNLDDLLTRLSIAQPWTEPMVRRILRSDYTRLADLRSVDAEEVRSLLRVRVKTAGDPVHGIQHLVANLERLASNSVLHVGFYSEADFLAGNWDDKGHPLGAVFIERTTQPWFSEYRDPSLYNKPPSVLIKSPRPAVLRAARGTR
jgi:hypothetical protein